MAFDSITNSTPNTEDFAKIKKVNRSAKLKQCKLDARRHQWLSQVLRRKTSLIERRRCTHDCMGEFNSGKSTFIDALLGEKYLQDGVVPTTNEITFLRYSDLASNEQQRCERHPDGQYVCYLPAPILKEDPSEFVTVVGRYISENYKDESDDDISKAKKNIKSTKTKTKSNSIVIKAKGEL